MRWSPKSPAVLFAAILVLMLGTLVIHVMAEGSTAIDPKPVPSRTTATFDVADDVLRLAGSLDRTAVLAGEQGRVKLELVLAAAADARSRSMPTDFVVVLDRSGSMEGEKIARARAAIQEILGRLSERDRFALVTYSSGSRVWVPMSPATAQNLSSWRQMVPEIQAGGGTNMSSGLDLALEVLRRSPTDRLAARRMLLISDGLANEGDSSFEGLMARAGRAAHGEIVLSAVGVGLDFNELLMSSLADRGTGNFYYLQEGSQLAEVFSREFSASRDTVASGLEVSLEPAAGVRLVDAAGYPLETGSHRTSFRPGSLFAGQERRLWLTLEVPTEVGEHELGRFRVAYSRDGRPHTLTATRPLVVEAVQQEEEFIAGFDKERWAEAVTSEDYGRLREKVAEYVRRGDRQAAKKELASYREETSELNRAVQSPAVSVHLDELRELEEEVDDAFVGADQERKQKALSKANQAAAWDQRRAGAKKER